MAQLPAISHFNELEFIRPPLVIFATRPSRVRFQDAGVSQSHMSDLNFFAGAAPGAGRTAKERHILDAKPLRVIKA
jgi:hypothetical protein